MKSTLLIVTDLESLSEVLDGLVPFIEQVVYLGPELLVRLVVTAVGEVAVLFDQQIVVEIHVLFVDELVQPLDFI